MSRRGWCHDTRGHSLDNGPVTWTTLMVLTHLIKWSQTHQDIWSEKERTLNAPLPPRFKAALFMARLHLPAIKDLLKGLQSFGVAKRAWARLQLMRAKPFRYLYCLFNSMNYELGKSTRGRTYIFRRTPLWRYLWPDVVTIRPGSELQTPAWAHWAMSVPGPDITDGGASAPLTVSWDTSAVATNTIME